MVAVGPVEHLAVLGVPQKDLHYPLCVGKRRRERVREG